MEVSFAFLCDYADQSGGKMVAVGIGFDTIYAPKIPATHLLLYAVIGLHFSVVEVGSKQVSIRLIDADGKNIMPPLDTTVNVAPPTPGYMYRTLRIVSALHGLKFDKYGDYSISWLVGEQEVKQVPFKVAEPPPLPSTA